MRGAGLRFAKGGALMTTGPGHPASYPTGDVSPAHCPAGHALAPDGAFCPTCGVSMPSGTGGPAPIPFGRDNPGGPITNPPWAGAVIVSPVMPYGVEPPGLERPAGRGRRKGLLIGIGLVLALAGAGVSVSLLSSKGSSRTTVAGTFVLADSDTASAGCEGRGGYSDISPGVPVILTNQDNKILGSTSLGPGSADISAGTCTYNFTISDIPKKDQSQYAIEVSHRGKVVNSYSEMVANGWTFKLSMGN